MDRMQRQGIMPSAVESATRGTPIPGKRQGTTAFYDEANDMTVITDSGSGRVITVDYCLVIPLVLLDLVWFALLVWSSLWNRPPSCGSW